MSTQELAKEILSLVGGEENVNSVVHCITRLRYKLKDESKADQKAIEKIEEVQGVIKKGGQFQIVLGPGVVDRVHEETIKLGNFGTSIEVEETKAKGNLFDRFVDLVAGIFTPVIGLLAASGMLKGFLALFNAMGLIPTDSSTYMIINAIGDTMFYFMPIILGYYAMKKFGGTPMLGALIGATLLYPSINALSSAETTKVLLDGTMFAADVKASIFGIPIVFPAGGYSASVVPVIAMAAIAAPVERFSKRIYPNAVSLFFVPMTALLVTSVIGLIVIGPIISIASSLVATIFLNLLNTAPLLYGFLVAAFWQVFVIFGLHWALMPMMMIELGEFMAGNVEKMTILVSAILVCFAQAGVVLAIFFKTKDEKLKKIAIPSFITALFGITEPALYGITLPRKRDFVLSCIAGGIGGFYLALTNAGTYLFGGTGIFVFLSFINANDPGNLTDFYNALIAAVISFAAGFVLVYFFGQKDEVSTTVETEVDVISPVVGSKKELSELDDDMFKNEIMGKTVALKATQNTVVAPISGKVTTVFPTKHAIGIEGTNGEELLVHVGIDTVELEGEHFESYIKAGDQIVQGDKLLEVDFAAIENKGYDGSVIVVLTSEGAVQYNNSEASDILFTRN